MIDTHPIKKLCELCHTYLTITELNVHLCGKETSVKCEYCDKTFIGANKLFEHVTSIHDNRKLYRCDECGKFLPMQILRDYHMMQHSIGVSFKCSMCPKTFTKRRHHADHERYHKQKERKKLMNQNKCE